VSHEDGARERIEAFVQGRVQGVGFRQFVAAEGEALRLAGTARNLPDGSVEVVAEGSRTALLALVAALRAGPPAAHVEKLRVRWTEARGRSRGFEIAR